MEQAQQDFHAVFVFNGREFHSSCWNEVHASETNGRTGMTGYTFTTTKRHSGLPYFKMPGHFQKYVSRDDFEKYLNDYAEQFNIHPSFNWEVLRVERMGHVRSVSAESETLLSKNVIVATGYARIPRPCLRAQSQQFSRRNHS